MDSILKLWEQRSKIEAQKVLQLRSLRTYLVRTLEKDDPWKDKHKQDPATPRTKPKPLDMVFLQTVPEKLHNPEEDPATLLRGAQVVGLKAHRPSDKGAITKDKCSLDSVRRGNQDVRLSLVSLLYRYATVTGSVTSQCWIQHQDSGFHTPMIDSEYHQIRSPESRHNGG
ncbi:uncharacterized protein PGTG_04427 [Puccinia graminis f. sp. tritici CRL 75-36-700-3]|uniref:Uncharacterized protein n=1 Tax=Puccinia graminis f. sp. tritici (strain CRL 75-36-700-3 / race SCCL) TaxID=418459 RepID=E3K2A2_PUCGT|nr:uncharacterized protein PGTG_04427 [Puccinia graminis f. sp. tritici CRL 75-36-700-3]EFP78471.1 hypothetical protein PGTG_04427 [Puccinia graminis f. sp. tritici CRL 75-36-700-3]